MKRTNYTTSYRDELIAAAEQNRQQKKDQATETITLVDLNGRGESRFGYITKEGSKYVLHKGTSFVYCLSADELFSVLTGVTSLCKYRPTIIK